MARALIECKLKERPYNLYVGSSVFVLNQFTAYSVPSKILLCKISI